MNHGNTNKPRLDTWFWWSKKNTQVTEQVSRTSCDKDTIESVEKEEKQDFQIQSQFTVDFFVCEPQLDWSAQTAAVSNYHFTHFPWRDRSSSLTNTNTWEHFISLSISIFVPFPNLSPLLINLLIRNYANDPKTERKSVSQCGCYSVCLYCAELVLKKSNPQRKALQRAVSPAPLLSHPPSLPLERGGRLRGIRVRIRGLCQRRQHGKKMNLDRKLQIKSNERRILREEIFSRF